jgi:hypothetical protein
LNRDQFNHFLLGLIVISFLGSMFNLGKVKTRGKRAYMLSAAFIVFALGCYLFMIQASTVLLGVVGAVMFVLIALDALFRMGQRPTEPKR